MQVAYVSQAAVTEMNKNANVLLPLGTIDSIAASQHKQM